MRADIAVATVSGKAYYRLVNELRQRRLLFLSLVPGEPVPPTIKVVITTSEEKPMLAYPNTLVYDAKSDPSYVVGEALRIVQNKQVYDEVIIGVDPGKTFGIAVLGDGKTLQKEEGLSLEKAIDTALTEMKKNPAKSQKVRIGSGVPTVAQEIARRLSLALSSNVMIEMVDEIGTSTFNVRGTKKKLSDADSATRIATRKGVLQVRRRTR